MRGGHYIVGSFIERTRLYTPITREDNEKYKLGQYFPEEEGENDLEEIYQLASQLKERVGKLLGK